MGRHSLLLTLPMLVSLACAKQASTTAPSEPNSSTEPAPVEPPSEVEAEEQEEEDTEADDLDAMSDEELAEMEAEMDAEMEAEVGEEGGQDTAHYETYNGGFGGRGKKVPNVRQATATVDGPLDKDIVRRIVRAHINEVRSCYNGGLTKDPTLTGKVAVEFTITADGLVSASTVAESDLADASVGECIAKVAKRWKFPKPTDGGEVRVLYPFLLEPG